MCSITLHSLRISITSGTMRVAAESKDFCAAKAFAQVGNILSKSDNFALGVSEHSVSEPAMSAVSTMPTVTGDSKKPVLEATGDSVMWKPASISLAAILLLLLLFF